ncbi:hypothetical protein [Nonomuraea jabiensis]|uniref:Uncharacterized protein n=1 Tax=Nonomuraea jabiensis TaxID=882448 RepID=A0A7W9G2X5_9ACTN|nr:hypothetical protein [Nonomuraea jabiensis]MBB5776235.1 hypothetical protein [Nonomuraea jabiensis]
MASRDLIIALKSKWDDSGFQHGNTSTKAFASELGRLERQARQQREALAQSGAQAGRFSEQLDDIGRTSIRTRRLLENATRRLPAIEITADTGDAEREVAALSTRLRALSDMRIGIDVDAREAANEAEAIRRQLTELAAMNPEVFVGANVERAIRDLDRVEREARDLDRRVNVKVDVDGASAASAAIGLIGSALATVRSSAPLTGAAVAAGIGALPGIAAVAANAVTVGLGGALAALGLAAAHGSDAAQDAIGHLKEAAKREAALMGQPFESVWTKIVQVAERELIKLSPVVRRNLAELAPEFEGFVDDAGASLEELTPTLDGVERAFSAVLSKLGPQMPEILRHFAAAINAITQAVEEDPQLLADFVTNLAKVTEWAANATASLAKFVRWSQENAAAIKGLIAVTNPAAGALGLFVGQADEAGRTSLNMGLATREAADDLKVIGTSADEASQEMRAAWASAYAEFSKLGDLLSSARSRASGQESLAAAQARAAEVQKQGAERIARAERELADTQEQAAERVKAAKQRVADAHRQAAEAVEAAQERVRDAEAAVTAAEEEGARRVEDAQRRVDDAREQMARVAEESGRRIEDAAQRLADAQADAAARQVDAERRVADAHRRTQEAVEDLTAARERAQERIEDLIAAESGAALDEEGAQLAIDRARQRLDEINADPNATELDRREADLAYRQALQRLEEVRRRNAELRDDLADAQRRGIDGSTEVVDAIGRIEDARRAEAEAADAAARQREESARTVADAEQALASAYAEAARQREDAARGLADAEAELDQTRVESAKAVQEAQKEVARAQQDAAQVAKDSARTVAEAQAEAAKAVRDASREIADAERAVRDTRQEAARDTRSANDSVLESWAKLRGDAKLTSAELLTELERQVRDQEQWRANLVHLAGRVPPEMLDELAKLGPGAAGVVATAAQMSDAELAKLIGLYGRSGKSAGDEFAKNLNEAEDVLRLIGYRHGEAVADQVRRAMDNGRLSVFEAARRIGLEIDRGIMGDRVVTIRTEAQEFAARISQQANGGILTGFADGGIARFAAGGEHHVAQIASANTIRVWAEPETQGEAYIPLATSKRQRSEEILGEVAERFGGRYYRTMPVSRSPVSANLGSMLRPMNNYSITVQVPPNADMANIGATTVRAIQEFERRSGTGWRAK